MQLFIANLPGLIFCFLLTIPAWQLGNHYPVIGGPVFAILIGLLLTFFFPKLSSSKPLHWAPNLSLSPGIKYTAKKILQFSIILLGFNMNLLQVFQVGLNSLAIIISTLSAAFITAYYAGKALRLDWQITTLIGVGTSICGGSAIAATAPVIQAKDKDISQAISTIFLFNILAVFIFPPLGSILNLSDLGFGMWAGTAINDTSSVVAAASVWSNSVGNNTALNYATIVKLTRTLMIIPITLTLAYLLARKNKNNNNTFSFYNIFPWFIIWFLIASLVHTVLNLGYLSSFLSDAGKFCIAMSMLAIGLNTDLKSLLQNGLKPLLLGISCWLAVAVVSLLAQTLFNFW